MMLGRFNSSWITGMIKIVMFPMYLTVVEVTHAKTEALMAGVLCRCEVRCGNSHNMHS